MKTTLPPPPLADTQRRLLDAAVRLIMRQGFAATTVDEICSEAELTKGSFFHYFKSKDEIGEKALEHYCADMQKRLSEAAFHHVEGPLEKVHAFLDHFAGMTRRPEIIHGCLIGDLAQEVAHTHQKIRRQCDAAFGKVIGLFSRILEEAKAAHPSRVDFDPESVATLFAAVMQGSMIVVKAQQNAQPIRDNLEHFRAYIDGLFGRSGAAGRKPRS